MRRARFKRPAPSTPAPTTSHRPPTQPPTEILTNTPRPKQHSHPVNGTTKVAWDLSRASAGRCRQNAVTGSPVGPQPRSSIKRHDALLAHQTANRAARRATATQPAPSTKWSSFQGARERRSAQPIQDNEPRPGCLPRTAPTHHPAESIPIGTRPVGPLPTARGEAQGHVPPVSPGPVGAVHRGWARRVVGVVRSEMRIVPVWSLAGGSVNGPYRAATIFRC